jgi:PAS domain S-box-containing protein
MNTDEMNRKYQEPASNRHSSSGPLTDKTEHLLHTILANVEDLIAVVDVTGKRLYNSPSYAKVFGKHTELRGTDSFKDIHPDDRDMVRQVFRETIETGVGRRIVYRFIVPDRPIRSIESQGNVIRDARGAVVNVVIVSRDISEAKQVGEERTRLDMAVEQAAESIVITDIDGTIVYANPASELQTGYTRDELIGANPRIVKSGKQDASFYRTLWATILRGETWSGEITNRRKNETLYREQTTISPVRDETGQIINFVAVMRDVTYQRQIESQMAHAQKMASLSQLARGIAHDLNNIFSVLNGVFTLMESEVLDDSLKHYLRLGQDTLNNGVNIGSRLMAFSNTDETSQTPFAISDVITTLQSTLFHTLEKTIQIKATIEGKLPLIRGDKPAIYQTLLTISLNGRDAILASPKANERGKICITADVLEGRYVRNNFKEATADTYVRVRVSDDGTGMGPEMAKHIFEPFFTTKEQKGNAGLGLAVAYAVVKAHGGFIDFESEQKAGTTFAVYLPALHVELEEAGDLVPTTLRGGSETILLVEDEESLRLVLEETLRKYGYNVLLASDGFEGYTQFEEHQEEIAAVVTDMGLPRESGYDMFLHIRTIEPGARVLFMSGYLDPQLRSKLAIAGATAFLAKPFTSSALVAKLREVLDQKE